MQRSERGTARRGGTLSPTGQCKRCIFRLARTQTCVAFPRGIPDDIATERFDHTQPYAGDGGIRFIPSRQ